jgi:hypothetical protein
MAKSVEHAPPPILPELVTLLRKVQFAGANVFIVEDKHTLKTISVKLDACPICKQSEMNGHAFDCRLNNVLQQVQSLCYIARDGTLESGGDVAGVAVGGDTPELPASAPGTSKS